MADRGFEAQIQSAIRHYFLDLDTPPHERTALEKWKAARAISGDIDSLPLTKRGAERALSRLRRACNDVLAALAALPDELDTFYSGDLEAAANEMHFEADWRLSRIKAYGGAPPRPAAAARRRLELELLEIYQEHDKGKASTYDPARYPAPRSRPNRQGRHGGGFALLLRDVYARVGIPAPKNLEPILAGLLKKARARRGGA